MFEIKLKLFILLHENDIINFLFLLVSIIRLVSVDYDKFAGGLIENDILETIISIFNEKEDERTKVY